MEKVITIIFFSLGFLFLSHISFMRVWASKVPYPPCLACDCTGNFCKKTGEKIQYKWPELVGVEIKKAKATIERTNPNVTVVRLIDSDCIRIPDVCCNRVWLCPDEKDLVQTIPVVG
ncbi:hypothetical protein P3S68_025888 [Capsicum galapagoense]